MRRQRKFLENKRNFKVDLEIKSMINYLLPPFNIFNNKNSENLKMIFKTYKASIYKIIIGLLVQ